MTKPVHLGILSSRCTRSDDRTFGRGYICNAVVGELVVSGTCTSYCKILLLSLCKPRERVTSGIPSGCVGVESVLELLCFVYRRSSVQEQEQTCRFVFEEVVKRQGSEFEVLGKRLTRLPRLIISGLGSTLDSIFANPVVSPAIFFIYSRTGAIAAFLQSSLRSDPDNPSVRAASRPNGKSGSNAVSLSICATREFSQGRLARREVRDAHQCQDSLSL